MTVAELERTMTYDELTDWLAWFAVKNYREKEG